MNKEQLVARLAERMDSTKAQAAGIVAALFAPDGIIADELASGGEVKIAGFGRFGTVGRAARIARNPRTGDPVGVPSRRVPAFRPFNGLKGAVMRNVIPIWPVFR